MDVSIDQVVDDGNDIEIQDRVKLNDENQLYYENVLEQFVHQYQYDEYLNPSVDKMEDVLFGSVKSFILELETKQAN